MLKLSLRLAAVLLFLCVSASAQQPDAIVELVRAAVRPHGGSIEGTLADYKYRVRSTSMTLDKNLKVDEGGIETELYEITPVDGIPQEKLLERNGKAPSEKELRDAAKRDEKSRKRKQKRMHEEFRFGRDFLLANDFVLSRTEQQGGHEVRVITYTPKKKMPKGVDVGHFKNVAGTLWIRTGETPILIKQEMHLIGPRRFMAGIVASASEAQFDLEYVEPPDKAAPGQQPIPWLPKHLSLYINMRVFGMKIRPKIVREYSDFQRVVPLKKRGKLLTPGK